MGEANGCCGCCCCCCCCCCCSCSYIVVVGGGVAVIVIVAAAAVVVVVVIVLVVAVVVVVAVAVVGCLLHSFCSSAVGASVAATCCGGFNLQTKIRTQCFLRNILAKTTAIDAATVIPATIGDPSNQMG